MTIVRGCILAVVGLLLTHHHAARSEVFTNSFLVRLRRPAERLLADSVANRNGFVNLGPVS